jgi:hypothetical protein
MPPSQTQPITGHKRGRTGSDSCCAPVHKQRPQLSAACLAQLCNAIAGDGLMQLPADFDVTAPNYHVQLARSAGFRAFVLRSAANMLAHVQSAAAASAMLQQDGAGAARVGREQQAEAAPSEVLVLGPALFKVAKVMRRCCGC